MKKIEYNLNRLNQTLKNAQKQAELGGNKITILSCLGTRQVINRKISFFKISCSQGHFEEISRYELKDRITKGCIECRKTKKCSVCGGAFTVLIEKSGNFSKTTCSPDCLRFSRAKLSMEYYRIRANELREQARLKRMSRIRPKKTEEEREKFREYQRVWARNKRLARKREEGLVAFVEGLSPTENSLVKYKQSIKAFGNKIEIIQDLGMVLTHGTDKKQRRFLIRCECGNEETVYKDTIQARIKRGCTDCMKKKVCVSCGNSFKLEILDGAEVQRNTCSPECFKRRILEKQTKFRIRNAAKINDQRRAYFQKRYNEDPEFKQKRNDTERIRKIKKRAQNRLKSIEKEMT